MIAALSLALGACRGKFDIHVTAGAPSPAKETPSPSTSASPVELKGLFAPTRTYFQTHGVVRLDIHRDGTEAGADLSLVDDTTHQSLIDRQSFLAAGLTGENEISKLDGAPFGLEIKLYPWLAASKGKFAYGDNQLRLVIDGEAGQKFAQSKLTLLDFRFLGQTGATFAEDSAESGGFQGDANRIASSYVTNGIETLTTGAIAILNQ